MKSAILSRFSGKYPRQFWLMFWGMFLNASGTSMIWPFLLIYVSGKLDLPLTQIATLTTINAACAILSSFIAGPICDRFGRKGVMVISLLSDAATFLLMMQAETYAAFAILLALRGLFNPLYRVGADAMIADLIPPEKRLDAYSLTRMITNAGIAIGPAVGGFLTATSYNLAFYAASSGIGIYGLLLALFARETLSKDRQNTTQRIKENWGGYNRVLRDRAFISTIGTVAFGWACASLMWILMPVYAKENFGIPENAYGWIPTTNALMVVLLQVLVTRFTRRFNPPRMMALGMFFYATASGLVALAGSFWGFWLCMVVMTVGELILVPTASTYSANSAPPDMRGRYMSIYGLLWPLGSAIGPVVGGILNDNLGPRFIWIGGMLIGLASTAFLARLGKRINNLTLINKSK